MDEIRNEQYEDFDVDLGRVLGELLKRGWMVLLAAAICAGISFLGTCLMTPQYESSVMFYVNNNAGSVDAFSERLESGDISAAKSLVDSYIVILETRETLDQVMDAAGTSRGYAQLRRMISAAAENDTEILRVVVTGPDPHEAARIADAIARVLPERIGSIIERASVKVVDKPVVPDTPSAPSHGVNTAAGFLLGFFVAACAVILWAVFDQTIRTEADISALRNLPVLAAVPQGETPESEDAYGFLRAKLLHLLAGAESCPVIGITGALSGSESSQCAAQLAQSLSRLQKRVAFIDCDMRGAPLTAKEPGLSDYLAGHRNLDQLPLDGDAGVFRLDAGAQPDNPSQLLDSDAMERLLAHLRRSHDVILLNLPAIGQVSDALTVAKHTRGMLLVVRRNVCTRTALKSAVEQLRFVGASPLGAVMIR